MLRLAQKSFLFSTVYFLSHEISRSHVNNVNTSREAAAHSDDQLALS